MVIAVPSSFRSFLARASVTVATAAAFAVVACSHDDDHGHGGATCVELGTVCHGVSTPLGSECHNLGHAGTEAKCQARAAECRAHCASHDAGHDSASAAEASVTADASDSSAEDASEICSAYCGCMKATCAAEPNYPFADDAACTSACVVFAPSARACYLAFCQEASDGGAKSHSCEHATGRLGATECP